MNATKENDYICGTCKYYVSEDCPMFKKMGEYEVYDSDISRDCWTDPVEVEQTEDEKRANAGCDEAHRIMVEGREII